MAARYSLAFLALSGGRSPKTKRRSIFQILLLLSVLLFSCRPATPPPGPADQTQIAGTAVVETKSGSVKPTTVPAEITEVRNGEYQLGATDTVQTVRLKDGSFEQGTPGSDNALLVVMTDLITMGDLNGDGQDEVAVLVSENYGGSGAFVFLAVYANVDGNLAFQTSTMVDDRPQLNALSVDKGEIFLDVVIHGTDEPMCCPSLRTTRHYILVDNLLDMTEYTTFTPDGKPRTITIEAPAQGSEVYSSVTVKGNVAIAPFENNLTYRIYDAAGLELSIGAIPVTASDPGAPGTFNAMIPIGNILSGTVVRIAVQDISAEDGSLLAMDSVELVVK